MSQYKILENRVFFSCLAVFGFIVVAFVGGTTHAQETLLSAKEDYITCWKQPCVRAAGSEWSEKNPNSVGISVRMGTQPVVTDDQIKTVITRDFAAHGMTSIKFFFEQNDVSATGIAFHIRGGMEGLFFIDNVREQIPAIARRAANTNPLFQ